MTLAQAKVLTETIVPWITVGALIAGGVWTLREYWESEQDTRVARSLQLLERFNEELGAARLKIDLAWEKSLGDITLLHAALEGASAETVAARYNDFVLQLVEAESLLPEITRVLFFLDEAVTCAEVEICDATTVRAFLGKFSDGFLKRHTPVVCSLRSGWKDDSIASSSQRFFTKIATDVCVTR